MNIPELLKAIGLGPANSVVIGSGILHALELRASRDVDIVVTKAEYERLLGLSRFSRQYSHGRYVLRDGVYDIGTSWGVLGKSFNYKSLLPHSQVMAGVRYVTPEFLLAAKQSWVKTKDRPTDIKDIELLKEYLKDM